MSLLLSLVTCSGSGQTRDFALSKASSIYFRKELYVFGVSSGLPRNMVIYKTDSALQLKDSLFISVGQKAPEEFLQFSADTLHGTLEIFSQIKNKSEGVTIVRLSSNFAAPIIIKGIENERLNNQQLFSPKKLVSDTRVYDVRESKDSSGVQFYINAYERVSPNENYDYRRLWQFPAERKGVYEAHLVQADQRAVFLYVYRQIGTEHSQWLLKLNVKSGELIKAIKIAAGKDLHRICSVKSDKQGDLILCGQVMRQNTKPEISLWTCVVDSTGIKKELNEKTVQLSYPPSLQKNSLGHLVDITECSIIKPAEVHIRYTVYERKDKQCLKFLHSASSVLFLTPSETITKAEFIQVSPDVNFYFTSRDPTDRNGKICFSEEESLETLYQLEVSSQEFPRRQEYVTGAESWLLIRTDVRKNQRQYDRLSFENKKTSLKNMETIPLSHQPWLQQTGVKKIVIGQQNTSENYRITVYNW